MWLARGYRAAPPAASPSHLINPPVILRAPLALKQLIWVQVLVIFKLLLAFPFFAGIQTVQKWCVCTFFLITLSSLWIQHIQFLAISSPICQRLVGLCHESHYLFILKNELKKKNNKQKHTRIIYSTTSMPIQLLNWELLFLYQSNNLIFGGLGFASLQRVRGHNGYNTYFHPTLNKKAQHKKCQTTSNDS